MVNLNDLPLDLSLPTTTNEPPGEGRRVRRRLVAGGEDHGPELYHVLYLPPDWLPGSGRRYPVLVEYPGNGHYATANGDRSTGRMEDCAVGYGLSGGDGCIWVCLPFVDSVAGDHSLMWWGDAAATAAYCRLAVRQICADYGGDADRVVLCGFSRGAIACGYIGLRDDATAGLWCAMFAHSHYDGARRWAQPDDDAAAACRRQERFRGRPQWVSHEESLDEITAWFQLAAARSAVDLDDIAFHVLPYANHSVRWLLMDLPERRLARAWLADVLR